MTVDALINFVFKARNQAKAEMSAVTSQLEEIKKKAKSLKQAGQKIALAGAGLTAGFTTPVLLGMNKATDAASDLNETLSKTDAIFGADGESLKTWARTADSAFGTSQKAALDYASRFGGALKNIGGLTSAEAAKTSIALTELAADMNSFFNEAGAGDALASALTGEFESLKRFNVVVNETLLKQKALEMGLGDAKGAMSLQEKQAVTLALILEQTADAQGDFARTSLGQANAERILAAQYENQAAALGQMLLPVKLKLIQVLSQLIGWFGALSPEIKKTILIIAGLVAVIGPLLTVIGTMMIGFGALLPVLTSIASVGFAPLIGIVASVAGVIGLLVAAWQLLAPVVTSGIAAIKASVASWVAANQPLINRIKAAWDNLKTAAASLWAAIKFAFTQISAAIAAELGKAAAPFGGLDAMMQRAMTVAAEFLQSFLTAASGVLTSAQTYIPQAVQVIMALVAVFGDIIRWALNFSQQTGAAFSSFASAVSARIESVKQTVAAWVAANQPLIDRIKAAWEALTTAASALWEAIKSAFTQISAAIAAELGKTNAPFSGVQRTMELVMTVAGELLARFLEMAAGVVSSAAENLPKVVSFVTDVITVIGDFVRAAIELPAKVGAALYDLANGVKERFNSIKESINGGIQALKFWDQKGAESHDKANTNSWMTDMANGIVERYRWIKKAVYGGIDDLKAYTAAGEKMKKAASMTAAVGLGITGATANPVDQLASQEKFSQSGFAQVASNYTSPEAQIRADFARERQIILAETRITEDQRRLLMEQNSIAQAQELGSMLRRSRNESRLLDAAFGGLQHSIQGLLQGTLTWQGALQGVAGAIVNELVSSFATMAVSWIAQQVTMTTATVASNATIAASAAPAAALTSVASFGVAGILGALAVVAALAAVTGAFKEGGYTGDAGTSTVAGVVHGREFVNNAASTGQNRQFLEFLNRGGSAEAVVGSAYEAGKGSGGGATNVIIVDSVAKAQRMSATMKGETRIMIRDEIERTRG